MRIFLAILVPEEYWPKLKFMQEALKKKGITVTKDFHLTLHFFGDVDENYLKTIIRLLDEFNYYTFTAQFSELGFFKNGKDIRVIWYGLEPKGEFNKLQKEICKQIGIKNDRFHPHVTLARVKHFDSEKLIKIINKLKTKKIEGKFKVEKIQLIESVLTSNSPEYKILKELSANPLS